MRYMLWVVIVSSVLVNGLPSGEPVQDGQSSAGPADRQRQGETSGAVAGVEEEQSGAPAASVRLQLAFLVEDQQYNRHPTSEITESAGKRKSSSYGRRRRRSAHHLDFIAPVAPVAPVTVQPVATPPPTDSSSAPRDFGNIARILAIAGTKPKAVDLSGSYSGRRKRSDSIPAEHAPGGSRGFHQSGADYQVEQANEEPPRVEQAQADTPRDFGDIGRILAIAGTKPKAVDLSGSYSGRRKRSDVNDRQDLLHDVSREIQQFGVKHQISNLNGHFKRPWKRSAPDGSSELHGLVNQVPAHAVKVKSRGNYGKVAHWAAHGAATPTSRRVVFDSARYSRQKRSNSNSNFIPFSVYDQRRVRTLKIEQNDFLALPKRLKLEAEAAAA